MSEDIKNILELSKKEKKAIRMCDVLFISLDEIYKDGAQEYRMYYKTIKNLIENLISENKELKERNKRQQENLKITNKKIAAQRGQLMMLNKAYIPKSKAKEEINGKFKEAKGLYERGVQPQAQYTMKLLRDLEQSLLGKE